MARAMITVGVRQNDATTALVFAADAVSDFRPFFAALHPHWLQSRREVWETSGASLGQRWPQPMSTDERHVYIWAKAAITGTRPRNDQVLRWEGPRTTRERLYPSMVDPAHKEHIAQWTETKAGFGTAVPYAQRHQDGSGPKVPDWLPPEHRVAPIQRRIIDAGPRFERAVTETASVWLGQIANTAEATDGGRVRHRVTTADILASQIAGDLDGAVRSGQL